MPLNHDNETGRMTLALSGDGGQVTYAVQMEFCDNPLCKCGICTMTLTSDQEDGGEPKIVVLDLIKQKAEKKALNKARTIDRPLAQQVFKNLTKEDFDLLYQRFYRYKEAITRSANLEQLDTVFPAEEIERDGILVGYNEILPFAEPLGMQARGGKVFIIDQYCVVPGCDCKDAHLSFHIQVDKKSKPASPSFMVSMNYKTSQWTVTKDPPSRHQEKDVGELIRGFQTAYPDYKSKLTQRHARIKKLYAIYRRKHGWEQAPVQSRKIGRNDPCPCGSGKKYKKCCLLKKP